MNVIPVAAALLLLGGAAVYSSARDGVAPNAGARRTLVLGGWTGITLGSLGLVLQLGPIGGLLLALSVLGLGWIACALLTPVNARAAGLLTACVATALVVWGVVG